MRGRNETAGDRHIDDAHGGLAEEEASPLQSEIEVVLARRAAKMRAEEALQLTH